MCQSLQKTKGDNKPSSSDQTEVSSESLKSDIHQIKFQYPVCVCMHACVLQVTGTIKEHSFLHYQLIRYLKNTILKYMCSDVEEVRGSHNHA